MPVQSSHAFNAPGFTWLWLTSLFNAVAWTVQALSHGWLVLELTNSPMWVGIVAASRGIGMFAFSIPAGAIGDRMDRKRLVTASHAVSGLASLALAALVLSGAVRLWHTIAYSVIVGLVAAIEKPASSGLMYDLVGRERLFSASALRFLAGSLIRVVGAVAGGYVIDTLGVGQNYVLIGLAHVASVACVLRLRVPTPSPRPQAPFLAATREGLTYALHTPRIRRYLWLSLTTESFAFSYNSMLPVMARDVLRVGGLGLGYLTAASGLGQVVATLAIARRSRLADEQRVVTATALGFSVFIALFGLSPWFPLSLILVTVVGAFGAVYDAGMATVLLMLSADAMRARVQGLYNSTIGFNLVSGFGVGILATLLGAPAALAISGTIAAVSALVLQRPVTERTGKPAGSPEA
ncbi:MAG: MFS transporter [Armatimonadota bacterium]